MLAWYNVCCGTVLLYTRMGSNRGNPQSTIMYCTQSNHTHSNGTTAPSRNSAVEQYLVLLRYTYLRSQQVLMPGKRGLYLCAGHAQGDAGAPQRRGPQRGGGHAPAGRLPVRRGERSGTLFLFFCAFFCAFVSPVGVRHEECWLQQHLAPQHLLTVLWCCFMLLRGCMMLRGFCTPCAIPRVCSVGHRTGATCKGPFAACFMA